MLLYYGHSGGNIVLCITSFRCGPTVGQWSVMVLTTEKFYTDGEGEKLVARRYL